MSKKWAECDENTEESSEILCKLVIGQQVENDFDRYFVREKLSECNLVNVEEAKCEEEVLRGWVKHLESIIDMKKHRVDLYIEHSIDFYGENRSYEKYRKIERCKENLVDLEEMKECDVIVSSSIENVKRGIINIPVIRERIIRYDNVLSDYRSLESAYEESVGNIYSGIDKMRDNIDILKKEESRANEEWLTAVSQRDSSGRRGTHNSCWRKSSELSHECINRYNEAVSEKYKILEAKRHKLKNADQDLEESLSYYEETRIALGETQERERVFLEKIEIALQSKKVIWKQGKLIHYPIILITKLNYK